MLPWGLSLQHVWLNVCNVESVLTWCAMFSLYRSTWCKQWWWAGQEGSGLLICNFSIREKDRCAVRTFIFNSVTSHITYNRLHAKKTTIASITVFMFHVFITLLNNKLNAWLYIQMRVVHILHRIIVYIYFFISQVLIWHSSIFRVSVGNGCGDACVRWCPTSSVAELLLCTAEQSDELYFSVRLLLVVLHVDSSLTSVSCFPLCLSSAKRLSAVLQLSAADPGTIWLHQRSHANRWAA